MPHPGRTSTTDERRRDDHLTEHAAGNLRVLATMANELLAMAALRDLEQIDQKLYFEVFAAQTRPKLKGQAAHERA
jgi:hypothetical protein